MFITPLNIQYFVFAQFAGWICHQHFVSNGSSVFTHHDVPEKIYSSDAKCPDAPSHFMIAMVSPQSFTWVEFWSAALKLAPQHWASVLLSHVTVPAISASKCYLTAMHFALQSLSPMYDFHVHNQRLFGGEVLSTFITPHFALFRGWEHLVNSQSWWHFPFLWCFLWRSTLTVNITFNNLSTGPLLRMESFDVPAQTHVKQTDSTLGAGHSFLSSSFQISTLPTQLHFVLETYVPHRTLLYTHTWGHQVKS